MKEWDIFQRLHVKNNIQSFTEVHISAVKAEYNGCKVMYVEFA